MEEENPEVENDSSIENLLKTLENDLEEVWNSEHKSHLNFD